MDHFMSRFSRNWSSGVLVQLECLARDIVVRQVERHGILSTTADILHLGDSRRNAHAYVPVILKIAVTSTSFNSLQWFPEFQEIFGKDGWKVLCV